MYDRLCNRCGETQIDLWEAISAVDPVHGGTGEAPCGGTLERVRLPTGRGQVLGDECDVWVKHGICNSDGTPKRYTSKKDMREAAAKKGLENHVVHIGGKGSDKSKHTTKWT